MGVGQDRLGKPRIGARVAPANASDGMIGVVAGLVARERAAQARLLALASLPWTLLASCIARYWAISIATNIVVVGGILVAPVLSITGWIGLVLPAQTGLHHMYMALLLIAVIWTIGAVVGAHAFHIRRCTCER